MNNRRKKKMVIALVAELIFMTIVIKINIVMAKGMLTIITIIKRVWKMVTTMIRRVTKLPLLKIYVFHLNQEVNPNLRSAAP